MTNNTVTESVKKEGGFLRATAFDIEQEISEEYSFRGTAALKGTPGESSDRVGCMTICILVLRNGYVLTGESCCVSSENYNAEMGRSLARKAAVLKIWPLLGFRLRDQVRDSTQFGQRDLASQVGRMQE